MRGVRSGNDQPSCSSHKAKDRALLYTKLYFLSNLQDISQRLAILLEWQGGLLISEHLKWCVLLLCSGGESVRLANKHDCSLTLHIFVMKKKQFIGYWRQMYAKWGVFYLFVWFILVWGASPYATPAWATRSCPPHTRLIVSKCGFQTSDRLYPATFVNENERDFVEFVRLRKSVN